MTTATRSRLPIPDYDVFVEGDRVMLKSGSTTMTVVGHCDDCGDIDVAYGTSDGDIDIINLPPEALVRVD
jgi:hypothetical protein